MKALVCEGGGFKTAFTTGVFDAWIMSDYCPFDIFLGVSGGAVVMSSYISKQYKRGWELIDALHSNPSLTSLSRYIKGGYYLKLDLMETIWDSITDFDKDVASEITKNKIVEFTCTHLQTGKAVFIKPNVQKWKKYLRATSTLPFVSKCPFVLDDQDLVDGAFVAPIPVQRAIDLGATEITVIRTNSDDNVGSRINKILSNVLLKSNFPTLDKLMQKEDQIYAKVVRLINNPPKGITINNITTEKTYSSRLSSSPKALKQDYLNGLEQGLDFLN